MSDASHSRPSGRRRKWVDFRQVKAAVSFDQVLAHYNVNWLRKSGDNLRGRCPLHDGEGERAFHVSLEKGAFYCFSCKAKGNVLDFVAAMENCSLREAAFKLQEWFLAGVQKPKQAPKAKPEAATSRRATLGEINPPLGFELRVDCDHEYGLGRGFSPETLEAFGAGLCVSRGMFSGRFVIPLHDADSQLVGYAGRSLDYSEPKYLFPSNEKGFYKSRLLFNLHRVLAAKRSDEPVVVVEGFIGCMWLHQAGIPSVAILGSALSEEQEKLLASHFERVVLLFDGDAAGRAATDDCLKRLSRQMFVKAVDLADDEQPDDLSAEKLRELVG